MPSAVRPAAAAEYYVNPAGDNSDSGTIERPWRTIQQALDRAGPGDMITLLPGHYYQDMQTVRSGTAKDPIRIVGPSSAVISGAGSARIFEINHSHITIEGITFDGRFGERDTRRSYRDKLVYIVGTSPRSGPQGVAFHRVTFANAGGECVRLRYFASRNIIAYSTFRACGVHDFRFGAGGKNGEAIYIGTSPEQIRHRDMPTSDVDRSNGNWIHHNFFDTQGNECVDIKEGASGNLIEHNRCSGNLDPDAAGLTSRGDDNVFRYNEVYNNRGSGIRLGGDRPNEGIRNDVYGNRLHDNMNGGIRFQRYPQGTVCGNTSERNPGGAATGTYARSFRPTEACDAAARAEAECHLPVAIGAHNAGELPAHCDANVRG